MLTFNSLDHDPQGIHVGLRRMLDIAKPGCAVVVVVIADMHKKQPSTDHYWNIHLSPSTGRPLAVAWNAPETGAIDIASSLADVATLMFAWQGPDHCLVGSFQTVQWQFQNFSHVLSRQPLFLARPHNCTPLAKKSRSDGVAFALQRRVW